MFKKISIIGAGNVGGLTAARLATFGFKKIVLVDAVANLAHAKALDLNDSRFIFKQNYHVQGTGDITGIVDSEIIILTAGLARKPGMSREELIQKNSQIIKGICRHIKDLCPEAIIIVVTNPLDAMTYCVLKETAFPQHRVLGMGLTLDASRLANLISETLNITVGEVEPCIIGSHGQGMLPLGRYTKVKGLPLDKYLKLEQIKEIFQRTIRRGAEIVSSFGNGSAYFAPSAAISELVKVIMNNEKSVLPVAAYLNGEYEVKELCIGVPCRLGKNGIEEIINLDLNNEEREFFLESAESVKKQISVIYRKNL